VAAAAPAAPATSSASERSRFQSVVAFAPTACPQREEPDLPERDLASPAGHDDEREPEHGVGEERSRLQRLVDVEEHRQRDGRHQQRAATSPPHQPHEVQVADAIRHWASVIDG